MAIAGCLCGGVTLAQDVQSQDAQTPSDAAKAMIGAWEISNADHDKICRFVFHNDAVPGGYKLDIDKNCPGLFPSIKDIVAWAMDDYGNLRLLDAPATRCSNSPRSRAASMTASSRRRAATFCRAQPRRRSARPTEMAGEWAIARGTGKPICTLTLANNRRRRR